MCAAYQRNERTTPTTASFALKFNYVIYTQKKKFISESNAIVNSNFDKTFTYLKMPTEKTK